MKKCTYKNVKFWKRTLNLIFIVLISYIVFYRSKTVYKVLNIKRFIPDLKYVLLWNNIPHFQRFGQDEFLKLKCTHTNCYITNNRTFFNNLGYFDSVLFNAHDISADKRDLPSVRNTMQKYIFFANDSSDNYPVCNPLYDTFFNWTWTYKIDSTIAYTYFNIYNKYDDDLGQHFRWVTSMNPINEHLKGQLASKTRAAAIFLDKCKTRSKRELYVNNLKKELINLNMTLDVYGSCGSKKCKRKTMSSCFWRLKQQYFFYLAFEDSISTSYVTNEILYAYENYAVPIVYGGAEYKTLLPPHSYLNAMHWNEKMMARAIYTLIRNRTLYHNYFKWRNHYTIRKSKGVDPCDLCKALNNQNWLTYKTNHVEFRKWWNPFYETRCVDSTL